MTIVFVVDILTLDKLCFLKAMQSSESWKCIIALSSDGSQGHIWPCRASEG